MVVKAEQTFRELLADDRRFIETLFVVENKQRQIIPFTYNSIQSDIDATETGRDVWVKPSSVGFSTERIAKRLKDTLTTPGTNTVLIAYEDFISERLLSKVTFFYNHLHSLNIPGFPRIHHDSTYEKTFDFVVNGVTVTKSSIYIATARSFVAGRAEVIHHLLCDEFAFYPSAARDRILIPAMSRVPSDGTIDIFSTPNGQENDFYDIYITAKEGRDLGKSVFTPHFYPWFQHEEYVILLGDSRIERFIPDTSSDGFDLTSDEQLLMNRHNLSFDQIRWRRWKILEMESLSRRGETRTLFPQEFPEDDITCFLSTGDMYYSVERMDELAKSCYPTPKVVEGAHIWFEPERGRSYILAIDPGQAKITQTALTVFTFDRDDSGNTIPLYCARDAGMYPPELTIPRAIALGKYYNNAMIAWENNAHGIALAPLANLYRNVYYRRDPVSGRQTNELGWTTTSRTKDYMFQTMLRNLHNMQVYDIEFVQQLRNIRIEEGKVVSVGADDIHDSVAIALVCNNPNPVKKGYVGRAGWKW